MHFTNCIRGNPAELKINIKVPRLFKLLIKEELSPGPWRRAGGTGHTQVKYSLILVGQTTLPTSWQLLRRSHIQAPYLLLLSLSLSLSFTHTHTLVACSFLYWQGRMTSLSWCQPPLLYCLSKVLFLLSPYPLSPGVWLRVCRRRQRGKPTAYTLYVRDICLLIYLLQRSHTIPIYFNRVHTILRAQD